MLRAAILFCCFASPAFAQSTVDAAGGMLGPDPTLNRGMVDGIAGGSDDWSRCQVNEGTTSARAIRSCGRVIGERLSREHTAGAHYHRARHHQHLGDAERAQRDFERAIEVFGQVVTADRNANAYMNRASVYEHLEQYDNALADHAAALEANPEYAGPNYRRGAIFFRTGNYAQAIAEYDEAARKRPQSAYYQATRCEARAAARIDLETARGACDEAIHLEPDNAYARFSRGMLRFIEGDIDAALADFEASVALDAECGPAFYGRGIALTKLGRDGAADLARATELNGDVAEYYGPAGLRAS